MDDPTPLTLLEEVTTVESRQEVAMTLVKIYLGQGLVVPFLDYLNTREVHNTSTCVCLISGFPVCRRRDDFSPAIFTHSSPRCREVISELLLSH